MTAQSDLAAIRKIVRNTDEHRNRARREAWDAIKVVLFGEEPVVDEAAAEAAEGTEPVVEPEAEATSSEEAAARAPEEETDATEETAPAVADAAAPADGGERTSRFAEQPEAGTEAEA